MRRVLVLIILLSHSIGLFAQFPEVKKGNLSMEHFDFRSHGLLKLNGEWEFFENQLIKTCPPTEDKQPVLITVPDDWNSHLKKTGREGCGYGTYRLRIFKDRGESMALMIRDVSSSYKVWVNGELKAEAGKVDTLESLYEPRFEKFNIVLNPDTNFYEILIEVTNFSQHKGGIRSFISVIRNEQLNLQHERESLRNFFCLGVIFIIGFYHIVLFLLNTRDLPALNFGLFSFVIFLFLGFRTRIVYYFIKDFDWTLGNRIEYIALFFSLPLFYIFYYRSFPRQYKRIYKVISISISSVFILVVLFTNTYVFSYTLEVFHLVLLAYIAIVLIGLFKALAKMEEGGKIIFLGFSIFMVALVNDILHVQNIINTDNYIIFGVVGFIICQGIFLAFKSARDNRKIRNLSLNLADLNQSLSRFVPSDFVRLINKKSITEVSLGNNAEREMTIMFSDIRAFTTISEKLSPAEAFGFINEYLRKMAPIIRRHNGFIDKYMGDGIMALFPTEANDAVLASRAMMQALEEFNKDNLKTGKPQIDIGIGLHTGQCILGTVGEPMRMDTTVIADAVNLAARIESLTKFYKTPIIISEETFQNVDPSLRIYIRFIGEARVKGKSITTRLYKVFFDGAYDFDMLDNFDRAISLFYEQKFDEASFLLEKLKHSNLNDGVLQLYINQSAAYKLNAPPDNWKTFEVFEY